MKKILLIVFLVVLITSCTYGSNTRKSKDYSKILVCKNCGDDYYKYIETLPVLSPKRNLTEDRINPIFLEQKQDISNEELERVIIEELGIQDLLSNLKERKLEITTIKEHEYDEYIEKELIFSDDSVGDFYVLLLIPKEIREKNPAVVGLHGHVDSSHAFKANYSGESLAENGFIVIMPTFRAMNVDKEESEISKELYARGKTLMGLRVYETLILVDYLKHDLNSKKIGLTCHSGGCVASAFTVRISDDIDALIFDSRPYLPEQNSEDEDCQFLPYLYPYQDLFYDYSTLDIPTRWISHNRKDDNIVVDFFKQNLK